MTRFLKRGTSIPMKKTIEFDEKLIEYNLVGSEGPWLVCLPGLGCDIDLFTPLREVLSQSFRLIEFNHRGVGQTHCLEGKFSIKDLADDVLDTLNHLSIDTYSLIGISMGGFITQEILSRKPKGLKSASLLCSTFGGKDYFNFPFIKDEDIIKLFSIEKNKRAELSVATTTHPSLVTQSPKTYGQILDYRKNLEVSMETIIKQNHAAIEFMKSGVTLDEIQLPVFIGHGENDRFVPLANAKKMATDLITATLKTYPESDHFFFWEKGTELSKDLHCFFMEHS